ncbi:MAG: hypothetical protein ACTHVJ_04455 [Lactobacillus delbrueckii]
MKIFSKKLMLVSSVGLAGSAFAVTNTHPVFAASNTSKKTTVANYQAKVKSAQKKINQIQSKLKTAESQLNKANSDLSSKSAALQKAKKAVDAANSIIDAASAAQIKSAQVNENLLNAADTEYLAALQANSTQQQKAANAESDLQNKHSLLDHTVQDEDIDSLIEGINNDRMENQDSVESYQYLIKSSHEQLEAAEQSGDEATYQRLLAQSEEWEEKLQKYQAQVDKCKELIAVLETIPDKHQSLSEYFNSADSEVSEQKELAQKTAAKVQSAKAKLDAAQAAFNSAEQKANTAQAAANKAQTELSSLKKQLQAAQEAYDSAANMQSSASKNVDTLKQKLAIAKANLALAKAELALVQAKKTTTKKATTKKKATKKTPKKATKKLTKKTIKKSSKKAKSTKKATKKKVTKKVKKAKKVVVANSKFTSLKGSKKAFVGSWQKAKAVSGYQVRYSTASSMKKANTKSTKATKLKVSGLKSKKKYYVQLRSYRKLSGKTYYSAWTKAKTVKTR